MKKKTIIKPLKPIYLVLPKQPREYAFEIVQLKTKKARNEALDSVPKEYRKLVITHVIIFYDRLKMVKHEIIESAQIGVIRNRRK